MQGLLIYPLNYKKNRKYPLILMVHGGPESHVSDGWIDRYSYPVKYAASRGFMVFLPNYRGSSGRGESFAKLAQGKTAGKEFDDLVDGAVSLIDKGLVERNKIAISGVSYGGYAAAWGATALTKYFAASVMLAGYGDQISKFGTTDISKELYQVHLRAHPWDDWQRALRISPIFYTDKAQTPLLILHGEKDPRVHPSQALEMYRYIKTRTDTAVRLVLYPEEAHGFSYNAAQLDAAIRLMRWMEFYLLQDHKRTEKPNAEVDFEHYLSEPQ
ncbi:MAG: prolyl oligopeptidase family serine peptidase [Enterobacterales bacterium]|nr:prolyl oligopeptidase family serine peptidase [Enterobacterales bacterium]